MEIMDRIAATLGLTAFTAAIMHRVRAKSAEMGSGKEDSSLRDRRGNVVTIHRLKEVKHLIPEMSKYLFPEFEDFNRKIGINDVDQYSAALLKRCETESLPQTLVLCDEKGGLLACGALDDDDLEYGKYSECSPWVADLFTLEEYRGRGLAAILLDAIVDLAVERGFSKVYLWTEHPEIYAFYSGKGFNMLEEREYLGKTIGVFCREKKK